MAIYPNFRKEDLSRAYVTAVAAACGLTISEPHRDRDGWDLQVERPGIPGPAVKISLKATEKDLRTDTLFRYDLAADDHRILCGTHTIRRILVVLLVDPELAASVHHDEDALKLMKCAYWKNLRGETPTPHSSSVRVSMSREQNFSPRELDRILDSIAATNEVPPST